ncbi:MAG: hypothetical protein LLG04_10385 [Parachlamydia sp.]|nr:hypothetical protein [Parachlamydia sp.]
MKTLYDEMTIGAHKLQFLLDEGKPSLAWNGQSEERLERVVKQFPEISQNLGDFAKIANFLFSGIRFEVIEDIATFVERYQRLLFADPRLAAYGTFDVSKIQLPVVKKDRLFFYVEEIATGLPYRVKCPYPYMDSEQPFAYELLPYEE